MNVYYPLKLLRNCKKMYDEAGVPSVLVEPTNETPLYALNLLFEEVGEGKHNCKLETCFLPGFEEASSEGVHIMQSFITIRESVEIPDKNELVQLLSFLNLRIPLGFFGWVNKEKILYFKHNTLVDQQNGDKENQRFIDKQNGMILGLMDQFIDALISVAEGDETTDRIISLYT